MTNGKMFKVMVPIEGKSGTHWMRSGSAFTNKDDSINCYIDALPVSMFHGGELKFQIRELSEDELRRRDENRRSNGNGNGTSSLAPPAHGGATDVVPF